MMKKSLIFSGLMLYLVYVILPVVLIILGSFGEKWFGTLFPQGFTLQWYKDLFSRSMYIRALRMSIIVGGLSVIINSFVEIGRAHV